MSLNDSKKVGFLVQTLFRALLLFVSLILNPLGHAQSTQTQLSDLEAFVEHYPNVEALLADAKGLQEYRELLKSHMGYNHEFDPVFDKTIEQMGILVRSVPGFGEQIWANQAAGEPEIKIEASSVKRSGVETKSSILESRLEEQRTVYETEAANILALPETLQPNKIIELSLGIQNQLQEIEARYSNEIKNPSGTLLSRFTNEQRKLRQQYIHEKRNFFQTSKEIQILHAYLKYQVTADERWRDRYRSPFAEDSLGALSDLHHLTHVEEELNGIKLDPLFLDGLRYALKDALISKQQLEFEEAKDVIKKINKIKDAKLNAEIQAELQHIQHENPGIAAWEAKAQLSQTSREALDDFYAEQQNVYLSKKNLAQSLNGAYELPVTDQKDQLKFALRDQNSRNMVLRPTRAIHAAFSGHQTKECVGGASCKELTPRRWALSALKRVRTYLAEKGGVFDGVLRLVNVEFPVGSKQYYDDVDAMLKSIDSNMEIRSKVTGQSAKYPAFDAILDKLTPSQDSSGFIAGDGKSISQNTGLSAVYESSPSVVAADIVEKTSIRPADHEMEKAINEIFKESPHGYNPGGMIYEAMSGDGQHILHLKPRQQRRRYGKEELEEMLFKDALTESLDKQKNPLDKSAAWNLAVESDVRLGNLSSYKIKQEDLEKPKVKMEIRRLVEERNYKAILFVEKNVSSPNFVDDEMIDILSRVLNNPNYLPGANDARVSAANALKEIIIVQTSHPAFIDRALDIFSNALHNPHNSDTANNARWAVAIAIKNLVPRLTSRMELISDNILDGLNKSLRNSSNSPSAFAARQSAEDALIHIATANFMKTEVVTQIATEFSNFLHDYRTDHLHETATKTLKNIAMAHPENISLTTQIVGDFSKALRNPIYSETSNNARSNAAEALKKIIKRSAIETDLVIQSLKVFSNVLHDPSHSDGAENARWNVTYQLHLVISDDLPSSAEFMTEDILLGLVKTLQNPSISDDAQKARQKAAAIIKIALKHHSKSADLISANVLHELMQGPTESPSVNKANKYASDILKAIAEHMARPENQKALARLLRSMKRSGPEYNWIPTALMKVFYDENIIGYLPQAIVKNPDTRSARKAVAIERQTQKYSCTQLLQLIYLKHK